MRIGVHLRHWEGSPDDVGGMAHVRGGVTMEGGNGFFSTVEDSDIRGGATIDGYSGFWLGFGGAKYPRANTS